MSRPRPGIARWRLSGRVAAFVVVGAIGFAVDAGALALLVHGAGRGPYESRVLSFALAVTATWYLNHHWTFAAAGRLSHGRTYGPYLLVQLLGALVNLAVYTVALQLSPQMERWPVLALALGSAVALIFNYLGASRWVFARRAAGDGPPATG